MRFFFLVGLCVSLTGCKPKTNSQVIVGFASNQSATDEILKFHLYVKELSGDFGGAPFHDELYPLSGIPGASYDLPASYGVFDPNDDNSLVQIVAAALRTDGSIASIEKTIFTVLAGHKSFHRAALPSCGCAGTTVCLDGATCITQDAALALLDLPPALDMSVSASSTPLAAAGAGSRLNALTLSELDSPIVPQANDIAYSMPDYEELRAKVHAALGTKATGDDDFDLLHVNQCDPGYVPALKDANGAKLKGAASADFTLLPGGCDDTEYCYEGICYKQLPADDAGLDADGGGVGAPTNWHSESFVADGGAPSSTTFASVAIHPTSGEGYAVGNSGMVYHRATATALWQTATLSDALGLQIIPATTTLTAAIVDVSTAMPTWYLFGYPPNTVTTDMGGIGGSIFWSTGSQPWQTVQIVQPIIDTAGVRLVYPNAAAIATGYMNGETLYIAGQNDSMLPAVFGTQLPLTTNSNFSAGYLSSPIATGAMTSVVFDPYTSQLIAGGTSGGASFFRAMASSTFDYNIWSYFGQNSTGGPTNGVTGLFVGQLPQASSQLFATGPDGFFELSINQNATPAAAWLPIVAGKAFNAVTGYATTSTVDVWAAGYKSSGNYVVKYSYGPMSSPGSLDLSPAAPPVVTTSPCDVNLSSVLQTVAYDESNLQVVAGGTQGLLAENSMLVTGTPVDAGLPDASVIALVVDMHQ